MFGYGNYVNDMRAFSVMAQAGVPVIFDVTHSTQRMSMGGSSGEVTGGQRDMAPLLTRAAIATGYVDGLFLEIHTEPSRSKSDADVVLSLSQMESLLTQAAPLMRQCRAMSAIDSQFK
jgi:2-dehydro-3-deoxyphosphooctonate aldolase (KDO 8-P synthase)